MNRKVYKIELLEGVTYRIRPNISFDSMHVLPPESSVFSRESAPLLSFDNVVEPEILVNSTDFFYLLFYYSSNTLSGYQFSLDYFEITVDYLIPVSCS